MQNLGYAPIALFVYNRLDHTEKTINALLNNKLASESTLFVFSDGARTDNDIQSVEAVREFIRRITGFHSISVIESEENKGLAKSIVEGVTKVVNEYGKVIVIEDDIVTSPGFLQYMNEALDLYKDEPKVMHVAGYMYPLKKNNLPETFFYPATSCWGWATWKRAWENYNPNAAYLYESIKKRHLLNVLNVNSIHDFEGQLKANVEGRLNTWFIKWNASVILCGGYSLYPRYSLVQNVGFDGTGEHCESTNAFYWPSLVDSVAVKRKRIMFDRKAIKALNEFGGCNNNKSGLVNRVWKGVKSLVKRLLFNG